MSFIQTLLHKMSLANPKVVVWQSLYKVQHSVNLLLPILACFFFFIFHSSCFFFIRRCTMHCALGTPFAPCHSPSNSSVKSVKTSLMIFSTLLHTSVKWWVWILFCFLLLNYCWINVIAMGLLFSFAGRLWRKCSWEPIHCQAECRSCYWREWVVFHWFLQFWCNYK